MKLELDLILGEAIILSRAAVTVTDLHHTHATSKGHRKLLLEKTVWKILGF
jgi:hypothetical protein